MDDTIIRYLAPGALASAVLAFMLREWDTLYDLGVKTYDSFTRDRVDAPFEVLEFESSVHLLAETGQKATVHRRMKVRFLQDHVIAFQDHVWGDGNVLKDYKVAPGHVVDKYRDGDRWNLLISLRRTQNRGDIEEFQSERTVLDTFTKTEEWLQAETWFPTRRLELRVIFPKNRGCKRAWVVERSRNRTIHLSLDHMRKLPDGRTELVWQRAKPRRGEVFTLMWEW